METNLVDSKIILKNDNVGRVFLYLILCFGFLFMIGMCFKLLIDSIFEVQSFVFTFSILSILFLTYVLILFILEGFREITLTKEGYEVKIFFIKRFYKWEEIQTRTIEEYKYIDISRVDKPNVKNNVIFCKIKIYKDKKQSPREFYGYNLHLFSFFSILLTNEETEKYCKNLEANYYRIDEELFHKLMKEWNVEIEGNI